MTADRAQRINARLPPEIARKLAYLRRRTGASTTEVVLASVERNFDAVSADEGDAAAALREAGFVGCAEGPADLSGSYKSALTRSLGRKA